MFSCLLCHGPCSARADFCSTCFADLPWNRHCCPRCAEPLPAHNHPQTCQNCCLMEPHFDHCQIPLRYEFPVNELLLAAKNAKPDLLKPLTRCLTGHIKDRDVPLPDLLVPVPLHPIKQRKRGFNQSGLVAQRLSKALSVPVSHNLIIKIRDIAQQKHLSRLERQHNLKRSFRVDLTEARELRGKAPRVALVDDIVTTGTTVNQLAKQLIRAGFENIDVWAIARTPARTPSQQ